MAMGRPTALDARAREMEKLRELIMADHRTYKAIGAEAGVSGSTIGALARGKTIWPRPSTMFGVLAVYGMTIKIVRRSN